MRRTWVRVRPGESFPDKALYEVTFAALSLPRVARRARRRTCSSASSPRCSPPPPRQGSRERTARPRGLGAGPRARRSRVARQARATRPPRTARCSRGGTAPLRSADRLAPSPGSRLPPRITDAGPARIETMLNWVDTGWIAPFRARHPRRGALPLCRQPRATPRGSRRASTRRPRGGRERLYLSRSRAAGMQKPGSTFACRALSSPRASACWPRGETPALLGFWRTFAS